MKNMICSACVMIMLSLTPFEACCTDAAEAALKAPYSRDHIHSISKLNELKPIEILDGSAVALVGELGHVLSYIKEVFYYEVDHRMSHGGSVLGNGQYSDNFSVFSAEDRQIMDDIIHHYSAYGWWNSTDEINMLLKAFQQLQSALADYAGKREAAFVYALKHQWDE